MSDNAHAMWKLPPPIQEEETSKKLLEKNDLDGLNPNEFITARGKSAIMLACKHDKSGSLLAYLLNQKEAGINAKNSKGKSALSICLRKKNVACARLLFIQPNLIASDKDVRRIKRLCCKQR